MTAITYWVIRYVPNIARGEFQNIGVICGSDDADWIVAFDWAYLNRRTIPRDVREWAEWFAREVNSHDRLADDHEFTKAWVEGIRQRQANAIQLAPPQPILAAGAREAADLLYPLLVHREQANRRHSMTRRRMRSAVRSIYQTSDLSEGVDYFASPSIRLGPTPGDFDFLQVNERLPILRNVWAFDMAGLEDLRRDIQAWNYGITRLRGGDGFFVHSGTREPLARDSVITAVIDAPSTGSAQRRDIYESALEAWEHEHVDVLTLDQLDERLNPWMHPG